MKSHNEVVVTPLYYWTDDDIWDYINMTNLKVNPLYKQGYQRVGCVGCPLATYKKVMKEFSDFPKYKEAYIKAFDRMLDERKKASLSNGEYQDNYHNWSDGQAVFDWWIEEYKRVPKGQMSLEDVVKVDDAQPEFLR